MTLFLFKVICHNVCFLSTAKLSFPANSVAGVITATPFTFSAKYAPATVVTTFLPPTVITVLADKIFVMSTEGAAESSLDVDDDVDDVTVLHPAPLVPPEPPEPPEPSAAHTVNAVDIAIAAAKTTAIIRLIFILVPPCF